MYAHASAGCLHVRPVLNRSRRRTSRRCAIAEETFEMVREYKGSHSGEHGDGLVRLNSTRRCSARIIADFREVTPLRSRQCAQPGQDRRSAKMDDRALFRYPPDVAPRD
jgi:hypothetical protein